MNNIETGIDYSTMNLSNFEDEFKEEFLGCIYTHDTMFRIRNFIESRLGPDTHYIIRYEPITHNISIQLLIIERK